MGQRTTEVNTAGELDDVFNNIILWNERLIALNGKQYNFSQLMIV